MRLREVWGLVLVLVACTEQGSWRGPFANKASGAGVNFLSVQDGAQDVPVSTSLLAGGFEEGGEIALQLMSPEGAVVSARLERPATGRWVRLIPETWLLPGSRYELQAGTYDSARGFILEQRASFTTAVAGTVSDNGLQVRAFEPAASAAYAFSTFYVLLSEPVDPDSVSADAVVLRRSSTAEVVESRTIVRGSRIAVDPLRDLVPGETYILEVSAGLKDLAGEAVTAQSMTYVIGDALLEKKLTLSMPGSTDKSTLDGNPLNTLFLRSRLVGDHRLSIEGQLQTELPDLALAGARVPLVIRAGQSLWVRASAPRGLEIKLGDEISTGLFSGVLRLVLLTDAVGEIVGSPFALGTRHGPPLVHLTMDASVLTEDPTVHSLLNQDLLHLPLEGVLSVVNGQLSVELVGQTEMGLLGMDTGVASVTLKAVSTDAPGTPPQAPDLVVRTHTPANDSVDISLDTAIAVTLSDVLDERSVRTGMWLEREGGDGVFGTSDDVAATVSLDGARLRLKPEQALSEGTTYVARVAGGIPSVSGQVLPQTVALSFTTRAASLGASTPPMVASVMPGVPCALIPVDGGFGCGPGLSPTPEAVLPANFPVALRFTRPVDANSVQWNESISIQGPDGGSPKGRFESNALGFSFVPDSPWEQGQTYTLKVGRSADAACGAGAVCDREGRKLNTNVLQDVLEEAGGPPVVIAFKAGPPLDQTPMALELGPVADHNANGLIDAASGESAAAQNSVTMRAADGGVIDRSYLSGSLFASVGIYDPLSKAVPLRVAGGSWMWGTSVNIFGIDSQRLIIRPDGDATGLLQSPDALDVDRRPVVRLTMAAFIDSVNDTIQQAMQRTPLRLSLLGRLEFAPDGSLRMELTNTEPVQLSMLQGNLILNIQAGDVRVTARTGALKR